MIPHITQPDDTNLEGHWLLDDAPDTGTDAATDSSSNGNHGDITGATWDTDTDFAHKIANWVNKDGSDIGDFGAYEFDGVYDGIEISDDTAIQNIFDGGGTISAWIKPFTAGSGSGGRVMDKRSASGTGWFLLIDPSTSELRFFQQFSTSNGRWHAEVDLVEFNEWSHLVVTYDNGSTANNPNMYINGIEVVLTEDITPIGTRDSDVGQDLNIGNVDNGSTAFDGSISDTRIYSEALLASDIWNLYAYSTEPDDTNLEGHWKMNGNALDSSSNGNDGTVSGAINTTDWNELPHVGHSLLTDDEAQVSSFDGVDDYVEISNESDFDITSAITISAWIKPNLTGNYQRIFHKNSAYTFNIADTVGTNDTIMFYNYGSSYQSNANSDSLVNGEWNYVTVTKDSSGVIFYVNGVEAGSDSSANAQSNLGTSNVLPIIGIDENYSSFPFNGQISNVAIYDTARTASQIRTDFLNGWVDTSDSELVSYWPLAGEDPSETYEDTGGSNDGT